MLVPLSWLRAVLPALAQREGREVADALIRAGLEVERVETLGIDHLVVGRVEAFEPEAQKNGKTIRWCTVAVGEPEPRGVVCGAANFAIGDLVVVALPGAVLPGDFAIARRKTYGHFSDGMICSAAELGLGTDHDGILVLTAGRPGDDAAALLELADEVLDIAVTPDRGYQLSIRGIAREAAVAFGLDYADPAADPAGGALPVVPAGVEVAVDAGCDRYLALTLAGIATPASSPGWLARRLERAGMRSVSPVVDVTNHVMLELGQPLHAFDADRVRGPLTVRRAHAGERLVTLDNVDRTLDPDDLVIADAGGPVALAGVMGGAGTEIGPDTVRVLLEAAHFDPVAVARTARRHKLPSEASRRFERGVDPGLPDRAAASALQLLRVLGGATAVALTDIDLRAPRAAIALPVAYPGAVGGREVSAEVVRRRLAEVGCEIGPEDPPGVLVVSPPGWRPDLLAPIDLVEEVLRLEGYDTLPSVLPAAPAGRGLTRGQRQRRAVSRALAEAGFVEALTSPFTAPDPLGVGSGAGSAGVRVLNPLSARESVLRSSLLPGLLAAMARNVARGRPDVALFELGAVVLPGGGDHYPPPPASGRPDAQTLAALDASLPDQPVRVAAVLCGLAEPAGWWGSGRVADWSDAVAGARAVADALHAPLSMQALALHAAGAPAGVWHPGRTAGLFAGGVLIGYAGELHPAVVERLGLPARSCAMELDLAPLQAVAVTTVPAGVLSHQPAAGVDVALVVPDAVPAADVEAALRTGAGPLLEELRLFDVWSGAPVPPGSRSLAYSLLFRSPERTLSGEEVNAARDGAIAAAAAATGASVRA